ncbi:MAG: SRPBCC domain-containing protein [Flavobacteriaceae bacterium]
MKKIHFSQTINAPVARVYDVMLGVSQKGTYEQWTAIFNPTSTFEGNWEEGSKMYFIGEGEDGEKGGMVSEIAKNIPNTFVSIKHLGMLKGDTEILEGPDVEPWAGCLEDYAFKEKNGETTVTIEMDAIEGHESYFTETWPKALLKLKELVEGQ